MSTPGLLLVNLGSPDSPSVTDVRRYLREFLMDGRVIDIPWPVRFLLVHGVIAPFRARTSAGAYRKIWTPEGSPLVAHSLRVRDALRKRLRFPVEAAMRHRKPSIAEAIDQLRDAGVGRVHLIPQFPQYAMSSFETAVERVKEILAARAPRMVLSVEEPFYRNPDYIAALTTVARPFLEDVDHLLFSFHGVPERHLRKSDPTRSHCLGTRDCCATPSPAHAKCYRHQCLATMDAFVGQAGSAVGRCSFSFQSRLGRDRWLGPFTEQEIVRLARSGVGRLAVLCPSFVCDCLETLEEIGQRGRDLFLEAGGGEFRMIPCLNDHPSWVAALEKTAVSRLS
jgi:ferrochelatase